MPEGAVGLFPDVGMGWRLPRLPGCTGLWFALTGARLGPADALLVGLATDYVPSARLEAVKAAFADGPGRGEEALTELEGDAGEPPISLVRDRIDRLFSRESVEAIVAALERDGSPWARQQRVAILAHSPTTMKVAFRQLRAAARLPKLEDEMAVEYRLAVRIAASHDFKEGVRAVLVDKDRTPRWDPPGLADIDEARLDALFAAGEDWTPLA
jgi:enoyl-CoA hydratase